MLLSLFVIAIAANLLLGRRPDCNCFGQIKSTPIGWTTVVRNAVLACGAEHVPRPSGQAYNPQFNKCCAGNTPWYDPGGHGYECKR